MPLLSELFRRNARLQQCLVDDSAHVTPGSRGVHVALIQYAVLAIGDGSIDGSEILGNLYGTSTPARVLDYKQKRGIINLSYETTADNIVGKMTIARLDLDMASAEAVDRSRGARQLYPLL